METSIEQLQNKLHPEVLGLLVNVAEDPTYKSKYFAMGYTKALSLHGHMGLGEYTWFTKALQQLDDEKVREQFRTLYSPKDE
jgi:hypothetical protein